MGYTGTIPGSPPTRISTIPNRAKNLVPRVARAITDDATNYMLQMVKVNTPISMDPGVPGYHWLPGGDGIHLRTEIHRTLVVEKGAIYEAKVGSDKSYVIHVEHGTGLWGPKHAKYLIEPLQPGGWLVFPKDGKLVFARHVWHPGSPGQHMFLYGGRLTEMSMHTLALRGLAMLVAGMR